MRFTEFNPLLEFVDQATQAGLNAIDDIEQKLEDNPEKIDQVNSYLSQLINMAKQDLSQNADPAQVAQQPSQQVAKPPAPQNNKFAPPPGSQPPGSETIGQDVNEQVSTAVPTSADVTPEMQAQDQLRELQSIITETELSAAMKDLIIRNLIKMGKVLGDVKKQGGEEKEEEIQGKTAELKKIAVKVAKDKGMNDAWGKILYGIMNEFENNFGEKFLTHIANGTALSQSWEAIISKPMNKVNLKNIINPDLIDLFNPENAEPFEELKKLPLATSSGPGQGSGPGETILALLIPEAHKAGKGDLKIGEDMWEIKGGSYTVKKNSLGQSNAWLDCSNIKATGLRAIFSSQIQNYLKRSWSKIITAGDRKMSLSELSKLADFRPSSIWAMSYLFNQLKPEQRYELLEKMYDEVFPTLKKKYPKVFDSSIRLSAESILQQDTDDTLSDLHAKLAMLEYQVGPYQAKGIAVFNKTTNELMILQGVKGINSGIATGLLSTQTLTMQGKGDAKAHPGIFLGSDRASVEQQLGIKRTKEYKPKVRQFRESN